MSEFIDDEFSQFLDEESQHTQQQLEMQAFMASFDTGLMARLDAQGAYHLWNPSDQVTERNVAAGVREIGEAIARGELKDNGMTPGLRVHKRLVDEITMKYHIAMLAVVKDHGLEPAREARAKKELMAELLAREFDEGWLRTVDVMFEGEALDLHKEEDLQIYLKAVQDILFPEPHPIQVAVENIILSQLPTEHPEKAIQISHATTGLFALLLSVTNEPLRKPEAEAYIDEMFRNGLLSEEQRAQVRALLQ